MVFDEALALGVPILSTRTLSADELVADRNVGCVCDNDDDDIYDMLRKALGSELEEFIKMKPDQRICAEQFDSICGNKTEEEMKI